MFTYSNLVSTLSFSTLSLPTLTCKVSVAFYSTFCNDYHVGWCSSFFLVACLTCLAKLRRASLTPDGRQETCCDGGSKGSRYENSSPEGTVLASSSDVMYGRAVRLLTGVTN